MSNLRTGLISASNVREFFQQSVLDALANQHFEAADETVNYVVNLLDSFTRTEVLYDSTEDGVLLKPLAEIYCEAVQAAREAHRDAALRRLGDIALFIAGLFSDSLNRRVVDVDYYIAMGGNAYALLAARPAGRIVLCEVFAELADKFTAWVDVLAEVGEETHRKTSRDLMRTYELWLRTGSRRAARLLREQGIEPVSEPTEFRH